MSAIGVTVSGVMVLGGHSDWGICYWGPGDWVRCFRGVIGYWGHGYWGVAVNGVTDFGYRLLGVLDIGIWRHGFGVLRFLGLQLMGS